MERGFYNDEFEELLKQKADQYKMYPSTHVWKAIDRSLHTRKKWYWVSFLFFLGGVTWYAIVQLLSPSSTTVRKPATNITPTTTSPSAAIAANKQQAVIIPLNPRRQNAADETVSLPPSYVINPDRALLQTPVVTAPGIDPATAGISSLTNVSRDHHTDPTEDDVRKGDKTELTKNWIAKRLTATATTPTLNGSPSTAAAESNTIIITSEEGLQDLALKPDNKEVPTPNKEVSTPAKPVLFDADAVADEQQINWLQQHAALEINVPKTKRLSWQLSFSPTINYRTMKSGSAAFTADIKNIPMPSSASGDPDKLVNHKPALGFELGSHFLYAINKTWQIRAGAQFNYSRYAIQAYGSYQSDVATIALNSTTPGSSRNDSLTNFTRIRNFGGDMSEDIYNQYFQFSIPVGMQARVIGNNKVFIGVAGTVMPTWLINRNSYLITTDFKNYTKQPSLVKTWNVNTSAEVFLAYKTGDLQWQVGPQFRYQLFSSYVKAYPIREYLMEYGIRIAVTKTFR